MAYRTWTNGDIRVAVKLSTSLTQVVRRLGLRTTGGNYRSVRMAIEALKLDTSHFSNTFHLPRKIERSFEEMFCENSQTPSRTIRNAFKNLESTPYECQHCGLGNMWNQKPLTLQLEHKNGNPNDNRLENLEWLCPNCHTQTDTWGGRKLAKKGRWKDGQKVDRRRSDPNNPRVNLKTRKVDHSLVVARYAEISNAVAVGLEFGISDRAVAKIVAKATNRKPNKYVRVDTDAVIQRWIDTQSTSAVAKEFNCDPSYVRRIIRKYKLAKIQGISE